MARPLMRLSRQIWERAGLVLAATLLLLAPLMSARDQGLVVLGLLFATMALGLQLVVGWCRLFDLGFAGFVCIGAYTCGVLMVDFGWSFVSATVASTFLALSAGILLGVPTLRLESDYFAIVTFGFAELVVMIVRNWGPVTRGAYGLRGIPDPVILGLEVRRYPPLDYVYLVGFFFFLILIWTSYLRRTALGSQMVAVGDGPAYSTLCGIDSVAIKVVAFGLSAGVGGLVGALWAVYFKFVSYLDFSLLLSVQVVVVVVLGGGLKPEHVAAMGLILGPAGEFLRRLVRDSDLGAGSWLVGFGILLMILGRGGLTREGKASGAGSKRPVRFFRWKSSS